MKSKMLAIFGIITIPLVVIGCFNTSVINDTTTEVSVEILAEPTKEILVEVLIEPIMEYNEVFEFHENLAAVGKRRYDDVGGYYIGYIDTNGEVIIPTEAPYEYWAFQDGGTASAFSGGLVSFRDKNGGRGFLNKTGSLVIPFEYDSACNFSEGLTCVSKDKKFGFIDKAGEIVIQLEYDWAGKFSDGLAAVRLGDLKSGKFGYIDKTGKIAIPLEYERGNTFSEGLAAVRKNGKWGFIDKTGKMIIRFEYDEVGAFSEELACVSKDKKYGFIDKTGYAVVPFIYDIFPHYDLHGDIFFLPRFSEGLALVALGPGDFGPEDDKYGYIDRKGTIIPLEYENGRAFSHGLAAVRKNGKWGFIDNTGKIIVLFEYDYAESFSEGLAWVRKNEKWGILAINAGN